MNKQNIKTQSDSNAHIANMIGSKNNKKQLNQTVKKQIKLNKYDYSDDENNSQDDDFNMVWGGSGARLSGQQVLNQKSKQLLDAFNLQQANSEQDDQLFDQFKNNDKKQQNHMENDKNDREQINAYDQANQNLGINQKNYLNLQQTQSFSIKLYPVQMTPQENAISESKVSYSKVQAKKQSNPNKNKQPKQKSDNKPKYNQNKQNIQNSQADLNLKSNKINSQANTQNNLVFSKSSVTVTERKIENKQTTNKLENALVQNKLQNNMASSKIGNNLTSSKKIINNLSTSKVIKEEKEGLKDSKIINNKQNNKQKNKQNNKQSIPEKQLQNIISNNSAQKSEFITAKTVINQKHELFIKDVFTTIGITVQDIGNTNFNEYLEAAYLKYNKMRQAKKKWQQLKNYCLDASKSKGILKNKNASLPKKVIFADIMQNQKTKQQYINIFKQNLNILTKPTQFTFYQNFQAKNVIIYFSFDLQFFCYQKFNKNKKNQLKQPKIFNMKNLVSIKKGLMSDHFQKCRKLGIKIDQFRAYSLQFKEQQVELDFVANQKQALNFNKSLFFLKQLNQWPQLLQNK